MNKIRILKLFISNRRIFITYSLINILNMFIGLITNILVVRKINVSDFGTYTVILMFVGLINTIGFSWSSSSILYFGSKEQEKSGSINKTFWARNIIMGTSLIILITLFIIFNKQIDYYVGLEISFLILSWLFISVIEDFLIKYFLTIKRQILSAMISITAKFMFLISIIIFSFDLKSLVLINIISHATVMIYLLGLNKEHIGKYEFDKNTFKEILKFSLWQLFGFSGIYLINFGDTAVIKHYMTSEDVGIYNASYRLFTVITSFGYIISSYYASIVSKYFYNNNFKKIYQFFYRERIIILLITFLVHIFIFIFSKQIILLLYGNRYINSINIFKILLISSFINFASVFYMLYLNISNKVKYQQLINIMRAVLNVTLNIILIQLFGLIGPAYATLIAILISFVITALYAEKRIAKVSSANNTGIVLD